jgi:hypothetical protein
MGGLLRSYTYRETEEGPRRGQLKFTTFGSSLAPFPQQANGFFYYHPGDVHFPPPVKGELLRGAGGEVKSICNQELANLSTISAHLNV